MTVWYSSATQKEKTDLQKIVKTAARVIGCDLPSLDSLFSARVVKKSQNIIHDPTHPAFCLFQPLPSGRQFRAIKTRTCKFGQSFFPQAVKTIPTHP
ncbi:hypothetical protein V1264_024159 [Littorina saxatilis]|uniref:Uncharacterized protein n=1 Tax=Littorina saxatilis TaxID=31220 RepID=A0AAN9AMK7_9CAEN